MRGLYHGGERARTWRRLLAVMPGRHAFGALCAIIALHGCTCDNAHPCSRCPAIAGSYAVTFNDVAGTSSASCASFGIGDPTGLLVINQEGATLQATLSGFSMTGTLFDTDDLAMAGLAVDGGITTTDSMSISARWAPGTADAGGSVTGTVNTQYQRSQQNAPANCIQALPFTAQ
jgi:hypothetical protein